MAALHAAGLSNYAILRSGTLNPAKFLGAEGAFGIIKRGASADLLLLDGNPMEDIANMRRIAGVMSLGRWMPASWIADRLEAIATKNAGQ